MTDYYVDRANGSNSNDGLSSGTPFEDIIHGVSMAYEAGTAGHVVWVKGNGLTYDSVDVDTSFNLGSYASSIVGYGITPGDDCYGGTYPQINYNMTLIATGWSCRNFNIFYDANRNSSEMGRNPNWGTVFQGKKKDCQNINIHCDESHSSYQYGGIYSSEYASGHSNVRITASPGFEVANPGAGIVGQGNAGAKAHFNGIYCDARNMVFPNHDPAYFFNFNNNDHSSSHFMMNCVCIAPDPSGTDPMIGVSWRDSNHAGGLKLRNFVFVNCQIGIQIYTNQTAQADMINTWPSSNHVIEDCIFINCQKGIEFQSGFQFPFTVRNCAFYNSTTANIDGTALDVHSLHQCTQDPWDSTNQKLNEYGMSLLNRQTFKGSGTADFATPDPDRPYFQFAGDPPGGGFTTTDTGSFDSLSGHTPGDQVVVSGRKFQLIQNDPIVWRRV